MRLPPGVRLMTSNPRASSVCRLWWILLLWRSNAWTHSSRPKMVPPPGSANMQPSSTAGYDVAAVKDVGAP